MAAILVALIGPPLFIWFFFFGLFLKLKIIPVFIFMTAVTLMGIVYAWDFINVFFIREVTPLSFIIAAPAVGGFTLGIMLASMADDQRGERH
jgi:hypothetical protein